MGVDRRGNRRGKCTACDCDEFELPPTDDINMCFFCGHHSPLHERIETNTEACMHEVVIQEAENLTDPACDEVNNENQDSRQTLQAENNIMEQQDNDTAEKNNLVMIYECLFCGLAFNKKARLIHHINKVPTFEDLITPSAGPKVYYNDTTAWLVINEIDQLTIDVASAEEAVALGLAIYFIKDLNYPSSFSQLLGLIETLCLNNNNQFLGKRAKEILSSCVS